MRRGDNRQLTYTDNGILIDAYRGMYDMIHKAEETNNMNTCLVLVPRIQKGVMTNGN